MSRNTQGLRTVQGQIPEEILRIQFLTRRSQPKDIVAELVGAGPFREIDPRNHLRFHPGAGLHLLRHEFLAETEPVLTPPPLRGLPLRGR